ncbi:MAG: hydrogenase formation protein HypD [Actinobacteria bacterium]|nr:hydrogenase formation protein HypD [Actinomycetota bacterium]
MRYVDEFRDGRAAHAIAAELRTLVVPGEHVKLMEVCGGHTHAIYRHGLDALLPEEIELVHGPGCPVCVIPMGRVDDAISIAERPEVTFASFGDMLRVPGGRRRSLLEAKARGADVRTVYSPLDALAIAQREPEREVVFFGVGFETTAPATALTLLRARELGVENFSVFCNHVLIGPALRAILDSPDAEIDGFVGPGHVSTVIGTAPYGFVAREYGRPVVVSGFEPNDILQAIAMLLRQLRDGRCEIENEYGRVVREEGNPEAIAAMARAFSIRPDFEWRGLGPIPHSGLRIADELADWDAERRFEVPGARIEDAKACRCGDVLRGRAKPWECSVFATACTPEKPLGTCMVSAEGACAAYYAYGRHHR